jgi:hypothetical protein
MTLHGWTALLVVSAAALWPRDSRADQDSVSPPELPVPFTAAEFQKHVVFLSSDELAGRNVGTVGWEQAAEYVIRHFKAAGLKPLQPDGSWFQEFRLNLANLPIGVTTGKNILAVFPGGGNLKDQAVIVSAHLDHLGTKADGKEGEDRIFNGADDNASGVAAILLMAQALNEQKDALPQAHRTVIFASFDAEERGLQGAHHYARNPVWPLEQTAAVINFDSMGRLRMGKVYASDAETNPVLAQTVLAAAKSRGLVAETRFGGHGRSDHAVFLERKIPGMHFFTGANADYHQVTDQWERLNLEGGATVAWIGWQALQTAIAHPERLEFEPPNPAFDMQLTLNFVRTMGIIPALNAQEGRYPQILFVTPNSAAAKYGLKSGDQIAAVNGIRLNRVEDALTIFQQLTFEDGLRLTVVRGRAESEAHFPASFFQEMSGPKTTRREDGHYDAVFRYQPPAVVKAVYLAGDFNEWQPLAHKMDGPDEKGAFTTQLDLKEGVYQYKFVHEGTDWVSDPKNLYQVGKERNSVFWLGPVRK